MRLGRHALLALPILLGAACATAGRSPLERGAERARSPGAGAPELAAAGWHAWLHGNDPGTAGTRFAAALKRDPRDPWARLGSAMLARRDLDDEGEAGHLVALAAGAPRHPLAAVAARRLAELAGASPTLGDAVGSGLAPLLAGGKLQGLAAYRARAARAAAAEARGNLESAARLRAENGAVVHWTLAGPYGAYHALEIDRPFPPETGSFPARSDGAAGAPPVEPRPLDTPEGGASLDGEPTWGDVYYLAADVRLALGGRYLVVVGGTTVLRAFVDGAPVAERRPDAGFPPGALVVPRVLSPGTHRLLVKVGRGSARAWISVAFARQDGAPSDAESAPVTAGGEARAPVRPGPPPEPAYTGREVVADLEPEAGPALARLVAARDRLDVDRETAKALLDEARAILPESAAIRGALGDALRDDPTLSDRIARGRAEAEYDRALSKDPADAASRAKRAELMRGGDRLDDAQALVAGLPEEAAIRPRALVLRARLAASRGFAEGAERLAEEAWRKGADCQAAELLYDLASRRDAVAREDAFAEALASCPGGRERLAEHRRLRGDLAGAAALLEALARSAPSRVELRLSLARVLVARGQAAAAAEELSALARVWPREARIEKRRADALELAGDPAGARAARERALALDASDLPLRRALALEDGSEVLAAEAEDGKAVIGAWEVAGQRPETSAAIVLDAAAVEAHEGGAHTERVHQVIQVLDTRGVERWGEVTVPPGAELLVLRNLKKDGRSLEPEEAGGDKPSLSLPGLEPGDYVEYEYLRARPQRGPAIPGWTADAFFFRVADTPLWRSSYVVLAPRGNLEVDAHHMPAPEVKAEGGRDVLRVLRTAVPALVEEPGAPGIGEYLPFVQAGAGAGQEAVILAIADGLLERTRPSLEVRAFAARIARPPGSAPLAGEALLRAVYDRVNDAVEGQGGSWSEGASQILSRSRGSRTMLLKAVYAALGVKARLALVRTFGNDPATYRFPRPELHGYPVLRVEWGGRTFWLDPSTRFTPFGVLPGGARGAEALVVPEPGEGPETARTPEGGDDGHEVDLKVALGRDGDAAVEGVERYLGFDGAAAKAALERLDAAARRQLVEQSLARTFRGLALESLAVEGERQTGAPLVLRWKARVPGLARVADGEGSIEAPLLPVRLGARFVSRGTREIPLLVANGERLVVRAEIAVPAGAGPAPGGEREATAPFGSYRRAERWSGNVLVREDRFELRRSRVAPEAYPDFARFAAQVDEAQAAPTRLGPWR